MAILGIGVDLVHIPRIAALLARHKPERFASRILSKDEYSQWQISGFSSHTQRVQFLAVRWSVKEAAFKAMYPIIRPSWKEITYHGLSNQGQKPYIRYQPAVPMNAEKVGKIHVSVSHDGDYVYSSVVVEEPSEHQFRVPTFLIQAYLIRIRRTQPVLCKQERKRIPSSDYLAYQLGHASTNSATVASFIMISKSTTRKQHEVRNIQLCFVPHSCRPSCAPSL